MTLYHWKKCQVCHFCGKHKAQNKTISNLPKFSCPYCPTREISKSRDFKIFICIIDQVWVMKTSNHDVVQNLLQNGSWNALSTWKLYIKSKWLHNYFQFFKIEILNWALDIKPFHNSLLIRHLQQDAIFKRSETSHISLA